MKVVQLLEAREGRFYIKDTFPSSKDKVWAGRHTVTQKHQKFRRDGSVPDEPEYEDFVYDTLKYEARIVLSDDPPVAKADTLDQNALKDAYERAKAKFIEIRKAHPTQLRFETVYEAEKYMKTMEYPGWTLVVQWAHLESNYTKHNYSDDSGKEEKYEFTTGINWRTERKVKSLDLKKQEYKPSTTADDFIFTDLNNGRIEVKTNETNGPKFKIWMSAIRNMPKKFKGKNSLGNDLTDYFQIDRARPKKMTYKGSMEEVKKAIEAGVKKGLGYEKEDHEKIQNRLETRKADAKFNAKMQKQRLADLYAKYSKDIVNRVKIKPMSLEGDDGYQWALFLDGRRHKSGMTRYQAEGEQRMMWDWLLKWEKMTPKEQLDHMNAVRGLEAYFAYQAMEKAVDDQLPAYLDAIKKNVNKYVSAKDQAKFAIDNAKNVSAGQAKEILDSLMARLRKENDD